MNTQTARIVLLSLSCLVSVGVGCSRTQYRVQADHEAYTTIAERNTDLRWREPDYDIEIDPRSRYFETFDADRPPMPPDDPASHQYMHRVNGIKGWKHWHDNGDRIELENPVWHDALEEYVDVAEDGTVKLTVDSALELAYIHSPEYQRTVEELYLSALDVTTERFRLDTQFFGGFSTVFNHNGNQRPGGESSTLTSGRGAGALPFPGGGFGGGANLLQANRRFATAGEMLVGIANSFAWEFTQGDVNFASSIINASIVQPLLRGAGKDIALEQLTIVERALLGNLRAFHQYRQGFYTDVTIGENGVRGPQRRGGFFGGTGLTGFTGQGAGGFGGVGGGTFGGGFGGGGNGGATTGTGFAGGGAGTVGGFIGLLQQLQQIRNTEESLSQQVRTLSLLEAHLEAGVIDLTQVDQFRQSIETERANLLQNRNSFQFAVEAYITGTLGLPPDMPVELDDSLIRQFQLVAPNATTVQDSIANFQERVSELSDDAGPEELHPVLEEAAELAEQLQTNLQEVETDLERMDKATPQRLSQLTKAEKDIFGHDRELLGTNHADLLQEFDEATTQLKNIRDNVSADQGGKTIRELVVWLSDLYRLTQGSILIQARARLEAVTIEPIDLDSKNAFWLALDNRLDWMNARAQLVDTWRLIAFNADALQANVSVALSGQIHTTGDNPVNFQGHNASAQAGVRFDAPFTRLLERNNYRQSLIDYQRSRRNFIQSRDGLHTGLRAALRNIEQLATNLEIQRRAVAISIRRVDLTRESLNAPVPPPQPGQPPAQFGPTSATNLLTALSDLRNTQNNFMSVWLNYYASRMRLSRELGIMVLDEKGHWIDYPIPEGAEETPFDSDGSNLEKLPVPPPILTQWIELAQRTSSEESANRAAKPTPQSDVATKTSVADLPPLLQQK